MILSKSEIQNRIRRDNLIENYEQSCIKNSSYKVRIGELIEAKTGEVINIQSDTPYLLEPSTVVIFQSIEKINLPGNITASYSALYSIASKGILLINSSMIEPKYSGPLSGILLNFSSRSIAITEKTEIAKLNFYEVKGNTSNFETESISDYDYICGLSEKAANNYHKSFLNLSGLEKNIESNIFSKVKRYLTASGIVLVFLITFATLEPLFSRWMWEKTGIPTTSEQIELEKVLMEIKDTKDKNIEIKKLQNQIDSLKQIVIQQNGKE